MNARTGRSERVHVNLEAVYPNYGEPGAEEFCFEELRAARRGWLHFDWKMIERTTDAVTEQLAVKNREQKGEWQEEDRGAGSGDTFTILPLNDTFNENVDSQSSLAQNLVGVKLDTDSGTGFEIPSPQSYNDENVPPSREEFEKAALAKKRRKEERANRTRKIKVMDVKGATQTSK